MKTKYLIKNTPAQQKLALHNAPKAMQRQSYVNYFPPRKHEQCFYSSRAVISLPGVAKLE